MPAHPTFPQYLVGQASLERPAFFWAYAGMWVHLLVGALLLLIFGQVPLINALASLVISSFSVGILLYGVLTRAYSLLVNLVSYVLSTLRALVPEEVSFIYLVVAIIIVLVSAYFLLTHEYQRYTTEIYHMSGVRIPLWITVFMGLTLVFLCLYGLYLL